MSDEGILDFKDYDWSKPGYQNDFLQTRIVEKLQQQIRKYQTINPNVTIQFSKEPPEWVTNAIKGVGGNYKVVP